MEYRNRIPEPGTTISGIADSYKKKKKKLMPTDPRFFWHVTVNTHIFFLGLNNISIDGGFDPWSSQTKD